MPHVIENTNCYTNCYRHYDNQRKPVAVIRRSVKIRGPISEASNRSGEVAIRGILTTVRRASRMGFLARCYGFMVLVLLMVHPVQGVIPQNKSDHYYGKCEETYLLLILLSCLSIIMIPR
eukprot:sb/3476240/